MNLYYYIIVKLLSMVLYILVFVNCSGLNDNLKVNLWKLIFRMYKIFRIYIYVVVNVLDVFVYFLIDIIIFIIKIFFLFKFVC